MAATVLITRPLAQAEAFAQALYFAHGAKVQTVISPLIEIVPLPVTENFADVSHVVFTSVNGVAAADRIGVPTSIVAWCVGTKTAEMAETAGFDVRIAGGTSDSLAALIVAESPTGRMVHVRGRHVAGQLIENLADAGITCETTIAYDQIASPLTQAAVDLLRGQDPVIVPLFSPRTAKLFTETADVNAPLHLILISDVVDIAAQNILAVSRALADGNGMIDQTLVRYARFSP
jgi:uroporphyrinogen-III synthase